MANKRVSIREFARLVGVSDVAVGKAIKSGKIVKAIDWSNPKRPKLDPVMAAEEWGRNYDPSYEQSEKIGPVIKLDRPTRTKAEKVKPKVEEEEDAPPAEPPPHVQAGRSLAEIKRKTAEVKLHLAAVELKEKQGQLVDKDLVFRSLFAAGQEMRTALQAVPDRCIDNILAAKDRNEAHSILYAEITNALERLHEIYKRGLNDKSDED